jgi:putative membrane protein insertion efficiency factor
VNASLPARVLMGPIRAYRTVSTRLPSQCRYHPSCSQYALEALTLHGARHGSWLAVKRIGRCHPWGGGGIDPVPPLDTNARSTAGAV